MSPEPYGGVTSVGDLSGKARTLVEGQIRLEEQCIGKYKRYSSQAGDPALSGMLNGFITGHRDNVDALRQMLGGSQAVDSNAFEGQVYGGQVGGTNPSGYRAGGLAGTLNTEAAVDGFTRVSDDINVVNQEFRERPAGDNVGWQSSRLNDNRRKDRGNFESPADADDFPEAADDVRADRVSGTGGVSWVGQAGLPGKASRGGTPPSQDDPFIVDDVIETEYQIDAGYRAIEAEVDDASSRQSVQELRGRGQGRAREVSKRKTT